MEEKERFKFLFEECLEKILKQYPHKEGEERDIMGFIINTYLLAISCDIEKLDFRDFYDKYLQGTLFLCCEDFTTSEIAEIIKEARLNDRDKKLAKMYWVDLLCEEEISDNLMIDRKTVRNNIPKISMALKQASARFVRK